MSTLWMILPSVCIARTQPSCHVLINVATIWHKVLHQSCAAPITCKARGEPELGQWWDGCLPPTGKWTLTQDMHRFYIPMFLPCFLFLSTPIGLMPYPLASWRLCSRAQWFNSRTNHTSTLLLIMPLNLQLFAPQGLMIFHCPCSPSSKSSDFNSLCQTWLNSRKLMITHDFGASNPIYGSVHVGMCMHACTVRMCMHACIINFRFYTDVTSV